VALRRPARSKPAPRRAGLRLVAASFFDAFIASQDGKFTYWYIRPHQLDPAIVPLFPVPPFRATLEPLDFSATRAEIWRTSSDAADFVRATGREGGESRIWAGIHYPMDHAAGVALGKSVAQRFIDWAESDGSQ